MMNALGVFIEGKRVGSLSRREDGVTTFSRETGSEHVVSLAWPTHEGVVSPRGSLHPVFEQYLPEGQLRQHIEEAFL